MKCELCGETYKQSHEYRIIFANTSPKVEDVYKEFKICIPCYYDKLRNFQHIRMNIDKV